MSIIISILIALAQATSPSAYVLAQDDALPLAQKHYVELKVEATGNKESALRMEALGLIALLEEPDAESFLAASMNSDKDKHVAEYAKALLFRLRVAKNVKDSGKMSPSQFAAYKANVRKLSAEAMFAPASNSEGAKK